MSDLQSQLRQSLMYEALVAVEKLFASPGYYIGTRDGADPLAIDATFALVAQAVRAAKGEGQ